MFQKIIRKGMFKRIEKIGIKIVKGIIKKNQNTKHFIKIIISKNFFPCDIYNILSCLPHWAKPVDNFFFYSFKFFYT